MSKKPTRKEKMSDAFLVLGSQYYAHARYSAEQFYLPVSITLFHHAIEMLLKGFLSKTHTSAELKRLGHDLVALWESFKTTTANNKLAQFDTAISQLNEVEFLRYPDKIVDEGYALNVGLGSPMLPLDLDGTEDLKQYYVNVTKLDAIATTIFKACNVAATPYFKSAPTELKNTLPSTLLPMD